MKLLRNVLVEVGEAVAQRRKEPRAPTVGEVRLWLGTFQPIEIRGRLVDVSSSGFRVVHHHAALCAGQEVRFSHIFAGRARVAWNRVLPHQVESGFFILEHSERDGRSPNNN